MKPRTKTIIYSIIILLTFIGAIGYLVYTKDETYKIGEMEIEKKVIDSFSEVYGDNPFVICETSENGKCIKLRKAG